MRAKICLSTLVFTVAVCLACIPGNPTTGGIDGIQVGEGTSETWAIRKCFGTHPNRGCTSQTIKNLRNENPDTIELIYDAEKQHVHVIGKRAGAAFFTGDGERVSVKVHASEGVTYRHHRNCIATYGSIAGTDVEDPRPSFIGTDGSSVPGNVLLSYETADGVFDERPSGPGLLRVTDTVGLIDFWWLHAEEDNPLVWDSFEVSQNEEDLSEFGVVFEHQLRANETFAGAPPSVFACVKPAELEIVDKVEGCFTDLLWSTQIDGFSLTAKTSRLCTAVIVDQAGAVFGEFSVNGDQLLDAPLCPEDEVSVVGYRIDKDCLEPMTQIMCAPARTDLSGVRCMQDESATYLGTLGDDPADLGLTSCQLEWSYSEVGICGEPCINFNGANQPPGWHYDETGDCVREEAPPCGFQVGSNAMLTVYQNNVTQHLFALSSEPRQRPKHWTLVELGPATARLEDAVSNNRICSD